MEEATATKSVATLKKKSIFTDIVHLAGLTECPKLTNVGRESVLDLRTKPSFQSPQSSQLTQPHRSPLTDPSIVNNHLNFHQKSPTTSTVSSLLDHNHSFSAFTAPTSFFASSEPAAFAPFASPHHHAFHDFLPGSVLGTSSGQGGGAGVLCWPSGYGHTAASFLPSLSFRSQFPSLTYNLTSPTIDIGMASDPCLGQAPGGSSNGNNGSGQSKMPAATTTAARVKQAPRFQCPDCSRVYSTFSGLSKHRQFHCAAQLKRQFGCKFCQKHYTSLGALKMHIRTHTLPCKCDLCGKAFSRPWLLQGHVRTHTGEKPFRCLHCGRAFADRSNLRAHLQTHSDVKKYRCICCQKTFSRMSLLTKHESNGCPGVGNA